MAGRRRAPTPTAAPLFITEVPTEYLNNKHTIFGQVIAGSDVVKEIARLPRDRSDKPPQPVVIEKLTIERVAAAGR